MKFSQCNFDGWLKYCVHCHIALYSIEIVDDPQTNDELNTFSNFLTKEPIYNLALEIYIYASLPMSVCVPFSAVIL